MIVSILIPCYNARQWVAQAIESALNQTWYEKEIIVVDDGSTDGSLEVVKRFGTAIRWETGPNRGGNFARNRLLELASGEWLQYLDADDYLQEEKVAAQMALVAENTDAIYGSVTLEWWDTDRVRVARSEVSRPNPNSDIYSHWLNWQLAQTGAVLWRAESLRRIGGWNLNMPCCQDNEVCLRALKGGLKFTLSPDAGAVYRIWSSQTVCRKDPRRLINVKVKLIDEMLAWLRERKLCSEEHRQITSNVCFAMARSLSHYDLEIACDFARNRQIVGTFAPAARDLPRMYRAAFYILGFRFAENLAAWQRQFRVRHIGKQP